jgi:hypothetical protein
MDSIVKLEHQNKGDPVIQVCYLPIHPCVMKNHPQIVSTFPVQAFFLKKIITHRRDSFLLHCRQVSLLEGFALMMQKKKLIFPGREDHRTKSFRM